MSLPPLPPSALTKVTTAEDSRAIVHLVNFQAAFAVKPVDSLLFAVGTPANLVDSPPMAQIVFRHLPGVAEVERRLSLHARGHLAEEEIEELPHLLDDTSLGLFGITRNDTLYGALPEPVRIRFARAEWEAQFDHLGHYARDPNARWRAFDLDLTCGEGRSLHCLELFGRQLVCAVRGLHPEARLIFAESIARAA
jgi:hypothetical protein